MIINHKYTQSTLLYILLTMVFLLTGCGVHLHRPDDAQLARTALTTFKDAKLEDAIKMEFVAAAEIQENEIAAIRRHSTARRDRLLTAVIGGEKSKDSFDIIINYADKRLEDLLGSDNNDKKCIKTDKNKEEIINNWLKAQEDIDKRFESVRQFYLTYNVRRTHDDPKIIRIGALLSEQDIQKLEEPSKAHLKVPYSSYHKLLEKYKETKNAAIAPAMACGMVGEIIYSRNAHEEILKEASSAANIVEAELEQKKRELKKKIDESQAAGKTADQIGEALKEASKISNQISTLLQDLLNLETKNDPSATQKKIVALEEIRDQISTILPEVANAVAGQAPPAGDSEKIKILQSITAIRKGIDGIAYPRTSDLILESERLRIELERLRSLIALEEERGILLNLQLAALGREVNSLRFAKERATSKIHIESIAYLTESWSLGRTSVEEIDFRITGIDHRAALINSAAAFEQWSNLIRVPLSQLVAYHESGIRSEDLANLISAAGFSAIAPGLY